MSGVKASRELPVVWAVAKGSFLNKLTLVPSALLISYYVPALINILLIIGGLYLCYEGAEKVFHKLFHSDHSNENSAPLDAPAAPSNLANGSLFEKQKIKGAIRTDFILSAEIIVIILGTLQTVDFTTQVTVVSFLAIAFTVGVYGFVALIVKLDDIGLHLLHESNGKLLEGSRRTIGRFLLLFAPRLMKLLSIVGTAAMFLVGGGIIAHGIPFIHHFNELIINTAASAMNIPWITNAILPTLLNGLIGIIAGLGVLLVISGVNKVRA